MIKNLENKVKLQINRLETRIEKMQDMFNKNLEKPLVQPHPQGGISTIKRNHKLPAYRRTTPKTAI